MLQPCAMQALCRGVQQAMHVATGASAPHPLFNQQLIAACSSTLAVEST